MLKKRTFNIVLVKENKGVGVETSQQDKTVVYDGKAMKIKL